MKDLDLLEIAGKNAYEDLSDSRPISVNGSLYAIIDTAYDNYSSGMQAITLQNVETGEYVIAYQGTDPSDFKDIATDLSLGGSRTPKQLADAKHYYETMKEKYDIQYVCGNSLGGAMANHVALLNKDIQSRTPKQLADAKHYYETMKEKYDIQYVCGNSLGGAMANHVALLNKDIQSVTYNPAIVPGIVENGEGKNIRNYLGKHDPLTILQLGAGYHEKIPGKHIIVNHNIPSLQFLVANHVGYVEDGEIQLGGRNTPIRVNLIAGLPFSVFTNDFLSYDYQGSGQKITIHLNALHALCNGIEKIQNNLTYAHSYIEESKGIVHLEGEQFYSRLEELQSICGEIFSSMGFDFLSEPDAWNRLKDMLSNFKKDVQSCYHITRNMFFPINAAAIYLDAMIDVLESADQILDKLEKAYFIIQKNGIPALFRDVNKVLDDGLPMKLYQHLSIIESNCEKLANRLEVYKNQVSYVKRFMKEGDTLQPQAMHIPLDNIPFMNHTALEENEHFEDIVTEKNRQFEENFQNFKSSVHGELDEAFTGLYEDIKKMYDNIKFVSPIIPIVENVTSWLDIPIMKKDDEIIDNIHNLCKTWNKIKKEFLPALEGVMGIVRVAENRIDELLEAMKPYIKNAMFNNHGYQDVMIYNLSAYSIYESASVVFEDINYQLSENESKAICKLSENAGIIKRDFLVMMRQIERGTLQ